MDPNTLFTAILLCSVNAFFMIAGVFLNSVVIISLMRSSQLRRNLGYFMILVLSCFDLAVVTFSHPALLLWIILWSVKTHYQGENAIDNWVSIVGYNMAGFSMSALLTMSVERYLALKYPFFHHTAVTKRRLLLFQAFLMVMIVSVSPLQYLHWNTFGNALTIVFISLLMFLFIYLNYNMLFIAKSKSKMESSLKTQGNEESKRRKLNFKNISTCSVAIGCFFICALPPIIYSILILFTTDTFTSKQGMKIFKFCAITFFIINSTLNCLIFFWKNSILRREGMKTIQCFRPGRS